MRAVSLISVLALALAVRAADVPPPENRPLLVKEGTIRSLRGYVSSDRCRSCHPAQYATWHNSYHRTMAQVVTAETVIADFDDVTLVNGSRQWKLSRGEGGEFLVRLPDGSERRVAQSTGLHHYQLYWYPSGRGRELNMLPFVFLSGERRWVPRSSVFLKPPAAAEEHLVWNLHCLPCHSTDGRPAYRPPAAGAGGAVPDSRVAELGIACEACHGPGRDHVDAYRAGAHQGPTKIVHPGKLSAPLAAQVCGQCHSFNVPYRPKDWADWLLDGPTFRPGDDLTKHRYLVDRDTLSMSPLMEGWLREKRRSLEDWFWRDGEVRVTGREYTALRRSACFRGGEISCLNCHSPHAEEPDDLLTVGRDSAEACAGCHGEIAAKPSAHTRHAPDSSGSLCFNCHMPNTAYGLLKATRSHQIRSPSIEAEIRTGRPNACSLCHLDRPLAWAARRLNEWYGTPIPKLSDEQKTIAAGALGLLTGDAGERALWSWHMGWPAAQQASGSEWIAPFLGATLNDPYSVVRYIAARSLRSLPGYERFEYDYLAPESKLAKARGRVIEEWLKSEAPPAVPMERIDALLAQRDDRDMKLGE